MTSTISPHSLEMSKPIYACLCLSYFLSTVTKYSHKDNPGGKEFISIYSSRGIQSNMAGKERQEAGKTCLWDRKQAGQTALYSGSRVKAGSVSIKLQDLTPSKPLPPVRIHHLTAQLSQKVSSAGDHVFRHRSLWTTVTIKYNVWLCAFRSR